MCDYLYGKNSFVEAINNKRIKKAYVLKDSSFIEELKRNRIQYEIVDRKFLDKMSKSGNHQGVLAEVEEFKLSKVEDMLKSENGLIVVLDGLKDPHNLGAIIRTCECAGVDGIIYKKHNSVKVNDTVSKIASGALEYVKIAEVTNITNTLDMLKDKGYWTVGAAGEAKISYKDVDYKRNIVIIIGSEGDGISRLVKNSCDYLVSIPMFGHVNSLNASVAAGIMIYNAVSSR